MKLRVRAYAVALGLLLLCAGLFACATQVAPGGGPEDKLPPRVAAVYPAPMTTNHPNELYVKLEFDEWINASIPRSAVSTFASTRPRTDRYMSGNPFRV